jgi:hypothetical protein
MRNLFDQYAQPENRLTHALAVCLHEDPRLLRRFLTFASLVPPSNARRLLIVEQRLPGDPPDQELDSDRRGLPDIVIHDDDRWCIIIESKVTAPLRADQLRRHESTLRRRGFESVLLIAMTKAGSKVPKDINAITWSGLYEWLGQRLQHGEWADRLRDYLRIAEVRLARDEYLTEGTLTMFDGFPFAEKNPYTYGEAKRLLKLALEDLRKRKDLRRIGMDPKASGRPAITGRDLPYVWDFLSLMGRPRNRPFTAHPHLTLAIHADRLEVAVTIPHGVDREVYNRFASLGPDGLRDIGSKVLRKFRPLQARGATAHAVAMQRHYIAQRVPVNDAYLDFRLETAMPERAVGVKHQPQWIECFAELARRKRSNLQFQYRINFPWGAKGLDSRESLDLIANAWTALSPLLDAILDLDRAAYSRRSAR